jgi:lysozyme
MHDVARFEDAVDTYVLTGLRQCEFDACVSLAYNIGEAAFGRSTLCSLLNLGRKREAADQFPLWNKAGGRVLQGLVRRRAAERSLFVGEAWRETL